MDTGQSAKAYLSGDENEERHGAEGEIVSRVEPVPNGGGGIRGGQIVRGRKSVVDATTKPNRRRLIPSFHNLFQAQGKFHLRGDMGEFLKGVVILLKKMKEGRKEGDAEEEEKQRKKELRRKERRKKELRKERRRESLP